MLLMLVSTGHTAAQGQYTRDDVIQAAIESNHPSIISCIFRYEIGGVGYNPYATHLDRNTYGPGGLYEFGLLPEFNRWATDTFGYSDKYDPYQVAAYIDKVLDEGRGFNWPEYKDGRCR